MITCFSCLAISDQSIQGTGALGDFNKIDLVFDVLTGADLGEGCVPVGGKFVLLRVKPRLSSVKVKGFVDASPETVIEVKRAL